LLDSERRTAGEGKDEGKLLRGWGTVGKGLGTAT